MGTLDGVQIRVGQIPREFLLKLKWVQHVGVDTDNEGLMCQRLQHFKVIASVRSHVVGVERRGQPQ
eukprot:1710132-Pyramimonas_sp.AAC.1